MIKGNLQITEPIGNEPGQPGKKAETKFAAGETALVRPEPEKTTEKLDVKIRFARLKRRMRNRSAGIF